MTRWSAFAAVITLAFTQHAPAHAQMAKSDCEALRGPIAHAAAEMGSLAASIERTGFAALGSKVGNGSEAAAFEKLTAARQDALPAIRNYASALQDFAYAMQVCARP